MAYKVFVLLFFPFFLISQDNPNIIFIWADDLGNGEVGFTGGTFVDTPNIDTLAAQGTTFSRFYSQPVCTPSRAAVLTGRYPFRYQQHVRVIGLYEDRGITTAYQMLPNRLKESGYSTAIIGKWHLGHAYPEYLPQARGFDYSFGNYIALIDYNTYSYFEGYDLHENGLKYETNGYYTEVIGEKAVEYINQQAKCKNQPFFLYLNFTAPHTPLQAPSDTIALFGSATAENTKKAMIRILDNEVGDIINALQANNIDSNTIVIFTSDNGADLPGATIGEDVPGDNSPYRGEKRQLWEGAIRVPFIWRHPGTVTPGLSVDTVCHLVDIYPTIIEGVIGETLQSDSIFDGINFYPLLTGGNVSPNRYIIPQLTPNRCWAVIKNQWKLVNNPDASVSDTAILSDDIRLYDVVNDPGETTDVSGSNTSIVSQLQAIITDLESQVTNYLPITSQPGGWVKPLIWGDPSTFYNSAYYYYRSP